MSEQMELVPFEGRQIITVRRDDGIYVVMKPVVEALGLAWQSQLARIKRHPVISEGITVTVIPSVGGAQEATCLALDQFHGWLVTLSPDRIADEAKRDVIIAYQKRAFRVIFEHFHGVRAGRGRGPSPAATISLQNQALRLVDRLKKTEDVEDRRFVHDMLKVICADIGVDAPDLEHFEPEPREDEPVAFWSGLMMVSQFNEVDHSADPALLAITLPHVASLFSDHCPGIRIDSDLKSRLAASPSFIAKKAVNSHLLGKTVKAWVFDRYLLPFVINSRRKDFVTPHSGEE